MVKPTRSAFIFHVSPFVFHLSSFISCHCNNPITSTYRCIERSCGKVANFLRAMLETKLNEWLISLRLSEKKKNKQWRPESELNCSQSQNNITFFIFCVEHAQNKFRDMYTDLQFSLQVCRDSQMLLKKTNNFWTAIHKPHFNHIFARTNRWKFGHGILFPKTLWVLQYCPKPSIA